MCSQVVASAVRRGIIGGYGMSPHRDMAVSEPVLNQHIPYRQRGAWVPSNKANAARYEIPRAYMPFYELARVSGLTVQCYA